MSVTLRIRRYRAADHESVWALHNLALDDAGAHAGNGPWDADLHDAAAVRATYLQDGGEFLVGEVSGRIVVMGALRVLDATTGELKRMRVHPAAQRRGYGRRILEALEAAASQRGLTRLVLETTTGQVAARGLYEAHGYVQTGQSTLGPFTVLTYAKTLAPDE